MFDQLTEKFNNALKKVAGKGKLTQHDIDVALKELRVALLEGDVSLVAVKSFMDAVRERLSGSEISKALNPSQHMAKVIHEELVVMLGEETSPLNTDRKTTVIMLTGLQGVGKTSLAGKLARHLKDTKEDVLLVAADLQRPGAVQQLQIVGEKAGVEVYAPHPGVSTVGDVNLPPSPSMGGGVLTPVGVAEGGVEYAQRVGKSVVIVDTAGRLAVDDNLMAELNEIKTTINPHEVFLVVDGMTGQDAAATAQVFHEKVGCTGVVLTKLDGDTRGGAALSVKTVTGGVPIKYIAVGENITDLEVFHPDRVASRILDMGDMLTLIEELEKAYSEDEKRKLEEIDVNNPDSLTLDVFLSQLITLHKSKRLTKMVGLLPGMGQLRQQMGNLDDADVGRVVAILQSMTPQERHTPDILNGSRRKRVADGAGVHVSEVNGLLQRFNEAKKTLKSLQSPKARAVTQNRGQLSTAGRNKGGKKGGKRLSGNPAKRAQQLAEQRSKS